jgi:hypothetical protein
MKLLIWKTIDGSRSPALPLLVLFATATPSRSSPGSSGGQSARFARRREGRTLVAHDPAGQAPRVFRSYGRTLTLGSGREGRGTVVDVDSGQARAGPSPLAKAFGIARGLHETLLVDARWLVVASTGAMIVIVILGTLMGWPRITATVSGWHQAFAWGLLPLIVLSPLTALLMWAGITFATPAEAPRASSGPPMTLAEGIDVAGRDRDLSSLVWLRPQGGRLMARFVEEGEYRLYAVSREGTRAMPRNWPRLWHEGNFAGVWSAVMNVVVSLAVIGLLGTGLWICCAVACGCARSVANALQPERRERHDLPRVGVERAGTLRTQRPGVRVERRQRPLERGQAFRASAGWPASAA